MAGIVNEYKKISNQFNITVLRTEEGNKLRTLLENRYVNLLPAGLGTVDKENNINDDYILVGFSVGPPK